MEAALRLSLFLCALYGFSSAYIPRIFRGRPTSGFLGTLDLDSLSSEEQALIKSQLPAEQWFLQKLDHLAETDARRWRQRYFTSGDTTSSSNSSRVLFVLIGGEGAADPVWNVVGPWVQYGRPYGAVCLQLEHRYYGKSHPTPDTSLENLRYLSSEQALFDLAAFVSAKKRLYSAEKVIVFGGSYSGSLSAWFRLQFPHLVDGAVSTSAPLLAQVNFKGYLEVVRDSLDTFRPAGACNDAIASATASILVALKTPVGRAKLAEMFHLCDAIDITQKKDIANMFATLAGNIEEVVQYNKDNRLKGAKGANITIDTICSIMTNTSVEAEVERYAQVNKLILDAHSEKCLDFQYQKMVDDIRNVTWKSESGFGARQWTYQTCTEFGYYQSSDSNSQPFGHTFPLDFWVGQCVDIFGPEFDLGFIARAVARTNANYGGLNYTQDRVVFVNGGIDPWHYLSITHSLAQASAIYIPGTAHCANMYPPSPQDPPALTEARAYIQKLIGQWLQ